MRTLLLASATVFSLAGSAAMAQNSDSTIRPGHVPGVGTSEPSSNSASNIVPGDTRSAIAPTLPTPRVGGDAGPMDYLRTASRALEARHTGEAQEALERAEARALDRSTDPAAASTPDQSPMVASIKLARDDLGRGDMTGARQAIEAAMQTRDASAAAPSAATSSAMTTSAAVAMPPSARTSTITVPIGGGVGTETVTTSAAGVAGGPSAYKTVPIGGGVGPEAIAGGGGYVGRSGNVDAPGVPGQGTIPGTNKPFYEEESVESRGEQGSSSNGGNGNGN